MSSLSIGKVAEKSGLGIETIRFYERRGLIPEPKRKASGYRQYDADIIDRLQSIQQAKHLGFTLSEILELFSLENRGGASSKDIRDMAIAKLDDVETRLKMLKRLQGNLKKLINECDGNGPVGQCPILHEIKRKL